MIDRKRLVASATVVAMVFAIVPAAAFARGAASHGQSAEHGKSASAKGAASHSAPKVAPKASKPSHAKAQGRAIRRSGEVTGTLKPGGHWTLMPPGHARRDASGSVDATRTPKLTGIANALSRLQANLARMQAQLEAGRRAALPGGLVATIAKFMAWLGSTEPSTSPEPTSTPTPTDTPTPTGTVVPAPVE
jgi:hypothetical protein